MTQIPYDYFMFMVFFDAHSWVEKIPKLYPKQAASSNGWETFTKGDFSNQAKYHPKAPDPSYGNTRPS